MDIFQTVADNVVAQILFTVLILFIVQFTFRRSIGKVVRRVVRSHHYQSEKEEKQREDTLISIFGTALAVVVWIAGVIIVLGLTEVNIAALLTGAGLIGIVVGFGAQNTVKDFLAGVFVILENQYRVGDIITVAGVSGVVEAITIRITKLRDLDGTLHFVPNGEVKTVSNLTFGFANVNLDISVSYSSDVKKVEKVINQVGNELAEDSKWGAMITEPIQFLRVDGFDDSAVRIKALGKVKPATQWDVSGEYRQRLKLAFEKNGIEIPFPQRVIHQAK